MQVPGLELPLLADARPVLLPVGDVSLGGYHWTQAASAPTVLLLHGWGQDAADMAEPARLFHRAGWHALSLSLRGWRGSGGCDDYGRSAVQDLREALEWVAGQARGGRVLLLGLSLGGLVALLVATTPCSLDAVVAVSAPTDLRRTYRTTALQVLRRYYDAVLTPEQWDDGSPIRHASSLRVPALLCVGGRDTVCLSEEGRSFASLTGSGLLVLPDMRHVPTSPEWSVIVQEVTGSAHLSRR